MLRVLTRPFRGAATRTCCRPSPTAVAQVPRSMARIPPSRVFLSSMPAPPPHLFDRVLQHRANVALLEAPRPDPSSGVDQRTSWSYAQLLTEAMRLRDVIRHVFSSSSSSSSSSSQPHVAFLGSRGASYIAMQWGTWLAGAVAVPLHPAHPPEELEYILSDSEAVLFLVSDEFHPDTAVIDTPLTAFVRRLQQEQEEHSNALRVIAHDRPFVTSASGSCVDHHEPEIRHWLSGGVDDAAAQIVYTSGTTGRPKGVVTTHAALTAQIHDVVSAWEMNEHDHLLHFLPLHHVHGILNNLLCVQYAGGSLEFLASAKAPLIWSRLGATAASNANVGHDGDHHRTVTMLMAVPTIYMNLLEEMEKVTASVDDSTATTASTATHKYEKALEVARQLRVAISGSMACPLSILNRWETLTGLRLLERYGMTELGMALTNPLHGDRHLGYVGAPFPSVQARLVDPDTEHEIELASEQEGELRIRGATVFREYWRKPEATAKEFDADGWFKTGDIAQYSQEKQSFRIRGRASADIIKTAGYKISALDVERVLLNHPQVQECAVFGIPDEKWGQVVAAMIRTGSDTSLQDLDAFDPPLGAFMKSHLATYRTPRKYFIVDEIPKNAMGKVNKKSLAAKFS